MGTTKGRLSNILSTKACKSITTQGYSCLLHQQEIKMMMKRVFVSFAQTKDQKQVLVPLFLGGTKVSFFVPLTSVSIQFQCTLNTIQPILSCHVRSCLFMSHPCLGLHNSEIQKFWCQVSYMLTLYSSSIFSLNSLAVFSFNTLRHTTLHICGTRIWNCNQIFIRNL